MTHRVGIIGAGTVVKNLHLPALNEIPNVEIRGIANRNVERAKILCKLYKIPAVYQNYEELLQTDIDVVHICTPVFTHHQIVIDCVKARKHVLIEKPLCLTAKEVEEMLRETKKRKLKASVVQNHRFIPGVSDMKKFYDKFVKKNLLNIKTTHHAKLPTTKPWIFDDRSGGLLYEVGAHDLDTQLYFTGRKVESVHAVTREYDSQNLISNLKVLIEFEGNALGTCDLSWVPSDNIHNIEIQGANCNLFSDFGGQFTIKLEGKSSKLPSDTRLFLNKMLAKVGLRKRPSWYPHRQLISRFYECIEKNTDAPVPLEQGLRNTFVMEAVSKSTEKKKRIRL